MFYFVFLFIAALAANKWAQIEGACNNSLSNSWPVDCTLRAYLITPNSNNQTILTNAIDYAVYNSTTRNSTVWTLARRSSLNSYWNNIRTYIWDNTKYPTQSAKINKIIVDMTAYSSTDCPFKANNFYSIKLEMGGCLWGTIGDFVGCGNSTANVAMPSSNATTWPSICPPNATTSTMPMSTPSSVPTSTSGSNSSSGSSSNSSCKIITSSNWPVDCNERAYLITTDVNNKTIMTTTVYDTVYNVNTSNSTTWTTARKLSFNSYWNAMRNIIWAQSSMSTKINQLFNLLINYSAQDCNWQEYFFTTTLEFSKGCTWGSIGDFMACGNVSANFTMPSSTMAPICSINVTQSPDEVSTDSSGSNNRGEDSSTSSSGGGSSGSSNSSCKIVTSSNWPEDVNCAQRGNLLMIDSSNQTIMTKNVFDTVYNVNTSNSSVWTSGRKLSFNSYWNAMRKIIWDSESSMSTKINEFYNLMVSYSAQDCEWQAQFFSTSIVYGDDECEWGSIGDFLACGNASADYEVPTTIESTICPYGGISLNEEDGQTVIFTENGGGNGFTESINISLVTGFVNESFSGQTIEFDTVTPSSINVSDSTESTDFLNVTLFDLINITSSTFEDSTMSPSTELVTESSDVPISTSTDLFSTLSPFSESTESSLSPTMSNVTTSTNETESSTVTMTTQ